MRLCSNTGLALSVFLLFASAQHVDNIDDLELKLNADIANAEMRLKIVSKEVDSLKEYRTVDELVEEYIKSDSLKHSYLLSILD